MRWKVDQHVTLTERKHIVQLIDQGKFGAWYQLGRMRYQVTEISNGYQCEVAKRTRGLGLIGSELRWEVRTVYYIGSGPPSR